jgi:hypothetical protein
MPRSAAACLALLTALAVGACTAPTLPASDTVAQALLPAPTLALAKTDSCPELLTALRAAARDSVGPYGFGSGRGAEPTLMWSAEGRATLDGAGAPPAHSSTNVNEAAADEPDQVKTDGRRIVSVSGQTLWVIDAAGKTVSGSLQLGGYSHQLLLHGDRALVLTRLPSLAAPADRPRDPWGAGGWARTRVRLISLTGPPTEISSYEIDAGLVDARQIGATARVVVRSTPAITFQPYDGSDEAGRVAANRAVIDTAPVESWLPAYTSDGSSGHVGCGDVRRPAKFTGGAVVTVLSFGIDAAKLGDGAALSLLADSQTIYSNGVSLYLAHDARPGWLAGEGDPGRTELYQFDVSGDRPVYVASGAVPGWLLNQYSLNEHNGVLRAAATSGNSWQRDRKSQSSVLTLRRIGGDLTPVGRVDGLGRGEQIYSVRFLGDTAYVVTFRETDPLYTVDLRDPAKPVVVGELKIPGYSGYLHPVADGRLLGLGRGPAAGGGSGTQVSLFDVSAPATAQRVGLFTQRDGYSLAEHDPHAFLYWQPAKLVAIPMVRGRSQQHGVLLLRVEDRSVREIGWIETGDNSPAERTLVIGDTLWTFSTGLVLATSLDGAQRLAALTISHPTGPRTTK